MKPSFVIIGAGKLATHLSETLKINGYSIRQVYSRTAQSAKPLADKLNTRFTVQPKEIEADADIYIVAVKDSAYNDLLPQINFGKALVVHCSGSLPLSLLGKYAENTGVLYPLQTFSKNREVNFQEIPVFVEANSLQNEAVLLEITRKISGKVSVLDSEKRKFLHIAAVFACNFVNHLYTISSEILKNEDIPFEVLKPMILETAQKVQVIHPFDAQTGPAIRFDENIISAHLNDLRGLNDYAELYSSISRSIFEHHQKNK